jgi:hypothetical protein
MMTSFIQDLLASRIPTLSISEASLEARNTRNAFWSSFSMRETIVVLFWGVIFLESDFPQRN